MRSSLLAEKDTLKEVNPRFMLRSGLPQSNVADGAASDAINGKESMMKHLRTAAIVLGALLTITAVGFASSQATGTTAKAATSSAKKAATPATHATSGVVKSIDDSKLVITKSAGKGPETIFMVNASTQKEGAVAVGSMVDVRYHTEGKQKVATAVSVHEAKPKK
jgi:hypothetical protein